QRQRLLLLERVGRGIREMISIKRNVGRLVLRRLLGNTRDLQLQARALLFQAVLQVLITAHRCTPRDGRGAVSKIVANGMPVRKAAIDLCRACPLQSLRRSRMSDWSVGHASSKPAH